MDKEKGSETGAGTTLGNGRRIRTAIFYSLFCIYVMLLLVCIGRQLKLLDSWLSQNEASQTELQDDPIPEQPYEDPELQNDRIFTQLFNEPDWPSLYTLAGMEDTRFENKDTYAAFMGEKVGGTDLTCMQVSTELSHTRKYIVRCRDEKIAAYTLTEISSGLWELDRLELFVTRDVAVTLQKRPEQTAYINGVALDESDVISRTETAAQDYLPEGMNGFRLEQQRVEGLLMAPLVEIKDADGNIIPYTADENGVLCVGVDIQEISQEERDIAIAAAKANALFSIRAIGTYQLAQCFDKDRQTYKDICATDSFVQPYTRFTFDNDVTAVSDYYRYSDSLFSARVVLDLKVTRTNGYVKTFHADNTYFFTKNSEGKYLVTDMTNEDVQAQRTQVRLDFVLDSGTVTQFVKDDVDVLALPEITAEEGERHSGWATRAQDADGNWVMTVVFSTENGNEISRDPDKDLVPMVLYPVFENAHDDCRSSTVCQIVMTAADSAIAAMPACGYLEQCF